MPEIKREINEALQADIDGVIDETDLQNATGASATKKAKFSFDFDDLICNKSESNAPLSSLPERAAKEFDSYVQNRIVATQLIDPSFSPLKWWKSHQTTYPLLSKVVVKYV